MQKLLQLEACSRIPAGTSQLLKQELKYAELSPIQETVCEFLLSRQAAPLLLGMANNGSGKTLALYLYVVANLSRDLPVNPEQIDGVHVQAAVLAPTREIAIQIHEYFQFLLSRTSQLQISLLIGGLDIREQRKELLIKQPAVIVGTLGRLLEVAERAYVNFEHLQVLAIDEADKFRFDQQDTWKDLSSLVKKLPLPQLKVAAFSATFHSFNVKAITSQFKDMLFGGKKMKVLRVEEDLESGVNVVNVVVKQEANVADQLAVKLKVLEELLTPLFAADESEFFQVLIFHNYMTQAQSIQQFLRNCPLRIRSVFLNSEQTQSDRIAAFEKMRVLQLKCVIATDILARGVDLPDVRLVINLDQPQSKKEFTHRVGRAGRFGGTGLAVNLITSDKHSDFQTLSLNVVASEVAKLLVDSSDRIETRLTKEVKLLEVRDQEVKALPKHEAAYKRQKLDSKESMMGEWQEVSASNAEQYLYFQDDQDPDSDSQRELAELLQLPLQMLQDPQAEFKAKVKRELAISEEFRSFVD